MEQVNITLLQTHTLVQQTKRVYHAGQHVLSNKDFKKWRP